MESNRNEGESPSGSGYARSIDLPQAFRNMKSAKHFAVDIGGSLAKVAYMSEVLHIRKRHHSFVCNPKEQSDWQNKDTPIYEIREQPEPRMRLHFIKFETKYIESCVDFIQEHLLQSKDEPQNKVLKATGGGAFKYKDLLTNKLGVRVDKEDEMCCLIKGCCFMLQHIPYEVFEFHKNSEQQYVFHHLDRSTMFPFLLVNIGSGVSVIKVESEDTFERVGGTSMGGGTFWGLGSLLTKAKGFDELLALAENGEHRNVDMLVKDIYGGAYQVLGLPEDLTASSFGKTQRDPKGDRKYHESDIAKSLLFMISNDIGQIARLYAKLYGLKKVFFGGYFIRGNPVTMHTMSYAINYWSKGEQQALFLRHEGYLGAIGAFLKGAGKDVYKNLTNQDGLSWGENYAGSSGLPSRKFTTECDVLELDQLPRALVECPLLTSGYFPDTEDLTADGPARDYWLTCFEEALERVVRRAISSQETSPDVTERAEKFRKKYQLRISVLRKQPGAYGALTIRSLLDTREQCLDEFGFPDPYEQVKQQENEAALKLLPKRLSNLDEMNWKNRQLALVEGLLAGNVFDWGAKEVVKMMQKGELNFETAKAKLQERPWLRDDLDAWIKRLEGPPHKLAVVFVDNSGVDVILGVFPFVRELLERGSRVILAANTHPALNDVMFSELAVLVESVAEICPVVRSAVEEGRLVPMESGIGSPCLDLRRIDSELAKKCEDADLLVLEGMGRCIHTNYEATFSCESLKLAVIKNKWLANRLGGDMYSVVFRYEIPDKSVQR